MKTAVGLRRALHTDGAAGLFFLAATTLTLGFLLVAASRQWFAQDDWGYLLWRDALGVDRGTMAQYIEPHNGHWVAVPVLIYYANRAVFGLSSYWPFVAP